MKEDNKFLKQLENFRNESSIAARYLYAEMAIQHAASKSKKLLSRLNSTPSFWIVCGASLQSSAYISLGRIFDKTSKYNIDELIKSMEKNLDIFQYESLASRKRDGKSKEPDWLKEYLEKAHFPTCKDIERLKEKVKKYRLVYERAIKPARNKHLAHREKDEWSEIQELYSGGSNLELWLLTTFLIQLHIVLREQYHNGRKPSFRPIKYSVKSIYDAKYQGASPHELIVSDVKKLMKFIESAKVNY